MLDALIDLSHYQDHVDFAQVRAAGVLGVLHKATQGATYTDPRFAPRRALALSVGLLWGGYAFGDASDPQRQAARLLAVTVPGDLLALDVERNPAGASMTLAQAEAFVETVHAARGRYPLVYGGGDYLRDVLRPGPSSVLARCPLWYARYSTSPPSRLPAAWSRWSVWQYTDRANVPGVGRCDRDRFDGDEAGLRAMWAA